MLYFTDDNSPTSYDLTTVLTLPSCHCCAPVLDSAKYVSFPDFFPLLSTLFSTKHCFDAEIYSVIDVLISFSRLFSSRLKCSINISAPKSPKMKLKHEIVCIDTLWCVD